MIKYLLLASAFLSTFPCFADGLDDFVGTYQVVADDGTAKDIVKIEKVGPDYVFNHMKKGEWSPSKFPLREASAEELQKLPVGPLPTGSTGATNGTLGVFKVPAGWQQAKFKTESGYFAFLVFAPLAVQKK